MKRMEPVLRWWERHAGTLGILTDRERAALADALLQDFSSPLWDNYILEWVRHDWPWAFPRDDPYGGTIILWKHVFLETKPRRRGLKEEIKILEARGLLQGTTIRAYRSSRRRVTRVLWKPIRAEDDTEIRILNRLTYRGLFNCPYRVGKLVQPKGASYWCLSPLGALREISPRKRYRRGFLIAATTSVYRCLITHNQTVLTFGLVGPIAVFTSYWFNRFPVARKNLNKVLQEPNKYATEIEALEAAAQEEARRREDVGI